MPNLIILHGPPAAGKSTLTNVLREKLSTWPYVDRPNIKRGLKPLGREEAKKLSKEMSYTILKELMKLKKNIIVQEVNPSSVKKKLRYYLKKYNYQIFAFYIHCSVDEAIQRDKKRTKKTRAALIKKIHKEFTGPSEIETVIDTEKLSVSECIKIILKEIRKFPT